MLSYIFFFFTEHLLVNASDILMQVVAIKSIFPIHNDKLYIFSSSSFHAIACFNAAWDSATICFLEELFLAMLCKSASKKK